MILKNIIKCNGSDIEKILELRNSPAIRFNMYTSHIIDVQEHKNWVTKLHSDKNNISFCIFYLDTVIGLASINNINYIHKTSDWAFYLSPEVQGKGLGAVIEFSIIDYVFKTLNLEKLNCQVLNFNTSVIQMHEKFGFIKEGEIRSQIEKNNERVNVVHLGLTAKEWDSQRANKIYVLERYNNKVEIEI